MKKYLLIIFVLLYASLSQAQKEKNWYDNLLQQEIFGLTKVMFHDVTDPPSAARFYAYSILSAYEIASQVNSTLPRFQAKFKSYPLAKVASASKINKEFACLYALLETGKQIMPSGYLLEEEQAKLVTNFRLYSNDSVLINTSILYAKQVAGKIVAYSRTDGYYKLSTKSRYKILKGDEYWKPTAPEYMAAIQPYWGIIRPFFIDSAKQFIPKTKVAFDTTKTSSFFKLMNDVYETDTHLTDEQILIANYWDCNPFAVQYAGHMSVGLKKISPGGHWMSIAGILARDAHITFDSSLCMFAVLSASIHDAFISCWDEKYTSNRIRPETAINRYINEKWQPILQTPPFPEYTSGHSVISSCSAFVLTNFFGDNFVFTDTTEMYIGLPARKFKSIEAAANEAAISRLYGGIHFRDSIDNGVEEGKKIADFVMSFLSVFTTYKSY